MTEAFVALFVGLTVAVAALTRRDIRRAVRRRELRNRRRAQVRAAIVAMQGFAVSMQEFSRAAAKATDGLRRFADQIAATEGAHRSPFQPSNKQKGRPGARRV